MSSNVLLNIQKNNPGLKNEIKDIYDFFAEQEVGDFETANRIENFISLDVEIIEHVLNIFVKENLLKKITKQFCLDCDSDVELHENTKIWCDGCDRYKKAERIEDKCGYEVIARFNSSDLVFTDDTFMSMTEFQQRVIKATAEYILNTRRKKPTWLKEINEEKKSVREDLYRDSIEAAFKIAFNANGEINHTNGRSDLIINPRDQSLEGIIGEFKVWGSNDYKQVCSQLMSYMDNYENVGFIFMINNNQTSIWDKYLTDVVHSDPNYLVDSLKSNPVLPELKEFKHFSSIHQKDNIKITIFHFVFDNKF